MLRAKIFETIATISEKERERAKGRERAKDEASSGCEGGQMRRQGKDENETWAKFLFIPKSASGGGYLGSK